MCAVTEFQGVYIYIRTVRNYTFADAASYIPTACPASMAYGFVIVPQGTHLLVNIHATALYVHDEDL